MGVDVARGLAVLGMVGAHAAPYAFEAFQWTRIETWTDVVNGRSSILFAVIAGVSLALLSRGTDFDDPEQVRTLRLQLVGRSAVIFMLGLVLELMSTGVAVILPVYGVLFIAAIPFLGWSRKLLGVGAGATILIGPFVLCGLRALGLDIAAPGVNLVLFGIYPITVWLSMLFVGLVVGRLRLEKATVAGALLLGGAINQRGGIRDGRVP